MNKFSIPQFNIEEDRLGWLTTYIVEAWESRFPDVLTDDSRYLLWYFIYDTFKDEL